MADRSAAIAGLVGSGLPFAEARLSCGDQVKVAHQGAHVLSWVVAGRERLYLSPAAVLDGATAIRGGIPVCFPQFNQRGPLADRLPKHGFVRNLTWVPVSGGDVPSAFANLPPMPSEGADPAEVQHLYFQLESGAATHAHWPESFVALLTVSLRPGVLQVTLDLINRGAEPWMFTGALHTYLAVDDIDQVALHGLGGQMEWDALSDQHASAMEPLPLAQPHRTAQDRGFDRVYARPDLPLRLTDGEHQLEIASSMTWPDVVVWNPGVANSHAVADLASDSWRHMLCVEAARVFRPQEVAAGASWRGWQRLRVVPTVSAAG